MKQRIQQKEESQEGCREAWPDVCRHTHADGEKDDAHKVGEKRGCRNEREHRHTGRVPVEHGLRNASAKQIFRAKGRDGDGKYNAPWGEQCFHPESARAIDKTY
jgi:hypothetical protein